ncbi:MAG: glycoside hydrolase family 3 C-terminal domain-containing protein [Acidimicrobiales bacterium]
MNDSENPENDLISHDLPLHSSVAARRLVAKLSVEEKVLLLSGSDVWRTAPIERLGLPAIKVSDGPNGVRGDSSTGARAVCLPASIALGASFDVELVAELGRLLGRETERKGAHILLAPTINMARHPLGGRNFESFGEDPLLTSAMAVAYIGGVQDEGVGACAKHFVANDVEEARLTVSSQVDAQTLREVYLAPFEAAVDAGVWSVMAAYPKLNGSHCTENHWLLTTVLRREWGFDGLVMSDWSATHHPTRSVAAGLDLEMPGPARALGPELLAAVQAGELPIAVLDERAATVVDLAIRADRLGQSEEPERSVDLAEERELVRRAAADGMVLLRNEPAGGDGEPLLPFGPAVASVAVIGPNAGVGVIQGGGSAQLIPHYSISPLEGITDAFAPTEVTFHQGCIADRYAPQVDPDRWTSNEAGAEVSGLRLEVFDNLELEGQPVTTRTTGRIFAFHQGGNPAVPDSDRWSQRWTGRLAIDVGGRHRFGVLAVGRSRVFVDGALVADNWTDPQPGQAFFERASREVMGSIDLEPGTEVEIVVEWSRGDDPELVGLRFGHLPPVDEEAMLADAVAAAAAADVVVVVVGLTAEWETESHDRIMFGLPGRQDELVRRVAAANPRTVVVINAGGPVDLPWLDEVPATLVAWYPGQEFGSALAQILLGERDPGGRLPVTFPRTMEETPTAGSIPGDGTKLVYEEGLLIGHRWYSRHGIEPRLPFGHGLSYTRFRFDRATVTTSGATSERSQHADATVTVPVANIGGRAGKCVVQVYLQPADRDRPRVLAGFASATLAPGETRPVVVEVRHQALRAWDPVQDQWVGLAGSHRLQIGTSSATVDQELELTIT